MPIPRGRDCYTLNHYHKNVVQQNLGDLAQGGLGHSAATHVWQLVPDVFTLDAAFENAGGESGIVMPPGFEVPKDYVWQEHGYWHIGRSQVMFRKYAEREYYNNDMANQMKLNHMDMTFEPSWQCVPGEETTGPRAIAASLDMMSFDDAPGLGAPLGACRPEWAPALGLEALGVQLPEPPAAQPLPESLAAHDQHRHLLSIFATHAPKRPLPSAQDPLPGGGSLAQHPPSPAPQPLSQSEPPSQPQSDMGLGAMLAQNNKRRKKPLAAEGQ
jgi:hypothetical protein